MIAEASANFKVALQTGIKILFVHAAAEFATADVGNGYRRALGKMGYDVVDFRTPARLKYHALALNNSPRPELSNDYDLISRLACEGIVVEALREKADLVIVTAGTGIHPDGLELLTRAGYPIAVIFTESPYEDEKQAVYAQHCGHVFTNDSTSARRYGWIHLPAAYDPEVHYPRSVVAEEACDVVFLGTGWPERQQLLEAMDWTDIHLRIIGQWPTMTEDSVLWPFYEPVSVDNVEAQDIYASAKVALNFHRASAVAESLGPRVFQNAALGVFQISDWRPELETVFGDTIPSFSGPRELEYLIREHLRLPPEKQQAAAAAQRAALLRGRHTFEDRAVQLMAAIVGS